MLIIIFTASIILIIAMIGLKRFEESRQRKIFISQFRTRADIFSSEIIRGAKNFFAIISGKNAKLTVLFGAKIVFTGLSNVKRKISARKAKFLDSLKEEKNLNKKKGPTSFFLKNVSEYKNNSLK